MIQGDKVGFSRYKCEKCQILFCLLSHHFFPSLMTHDKSSMLQRGIYTTTSS
jgi:hypothetical protein